MLFVKDCELVKKTGVEDVTVFTGESVVLPCVCTDLQDKPKSVQWEFNRINYFQEIYPEQTGHHRNRVKLVSNNAPGDLSLLISDLTEEDQGLYRCSVQADSRVVRLYVKVGRRETSTHSRETDTTPPSEPPQRGSCGENVITEGHQDCEGKPEDQTEPDVVTFCTK
ncbi:hypothetical protein AMELA_G00017450 [Ameiurus melas]|uniref:Ig-like domain-containing protein n=1 Tax=Ameiurus melas TaxID=219545 RepID=A0A7J6BCC2_AMEME|nr:hypothetical protein AMELA_G00017450 [Ameiurus melas]